MKKILIIGMADSVHLANWLHNMSALSVEVTLVSSSPHRSIHPKLIELLDASSKQRMVLSMPTWSRRFGLLLWLVDRFVDERLRGLLVRKLIQKLEPDLVHVVEFQHAGYILLRALARPLINKRPVVMASNYGSDIYWFQRYASHKTKISALLSATDHYTSECERDIGLAGGLGFEGPSTLIPNTGGISEDLINADGKLSPASERKLILIKGYQNKFGQALRGVYSFFRIRRSLKDFEVVSISTNFITALALMLLRLTSGLRVSFHLKGKLTNSEVLSLMSRSRAYLGLSKSDGISTSLLEAMAMGAFPIQTGTACASEWIQDGVSGAIVSLGDGDSLGDWIERAISDDVLVDTAKGINKAVILARYTKRIMASQVEKLYLDVLKGE